ncbi:Pam17-domain-containing protein [Nemania serpens]|nr:Pam17-domain-containing protein [Nemania serpens]
MLTPTTAAATARLLTLGSSRGLQLQLQHQLPLPLQTTFQMAFSRAGQRPNLPSLKSLARQPCAVRMTSRQISTKVSFQNTPRKPTPTPTTTTPLRCQFAARRSASTASASSTASDSATAATSSNLDWNHFFQLRKTRRRIQLASSIVTMAIGGTGGAMLLVNMNMDWLLSKVPMDPIFALGIITLSFSGLGWLAGPSLGSAIFYSLKRGVKRPMAIKESEFFSRIKKNRVDPSNSSLSGNAVPDFYGEKISSVAGYRQWLKDQRAFNKKRTNFV